MPARSSSTPAWRQRASARRLVEALALAGFEVGIVNPRRIKAFRDAEGRRAKTVRLGAALIARFALAMNDAVFMANAMVKAGSTYQNQHTAP